MFPFLAQIPAQLTPRQAVEAIPDAAQVLQRRVVELAPAALVALLLLFFFWGMARGVSRLLGRAFDRAHVDPALRGLTLRLTRFFILMLGVLVAARQMGLEVGSLVAGLGIAGLAVGMAAQDLLANLIAGFTILWDRPFRVGDVVTIGSTTGSVAEIGLRTTRLWVADQKLVILPNREAIAGTVVNHTVGHARRLFVRLGIAFEQPLGPVRAALLAVAARQPGLLQDPPAEVLLVAFGESALQIELRAHLKNPQDEASVKFRLLEEIQQAFEQASIEFPYPHTTMRVVASPAAPATIGSTPSTAYPKGSLTPGVGDS